MAKRLSQTLDSLRGVSPMGLLIVLLIFLGACKPRTQLEIPEPVGSNTYLVYDGKQLIWRPLVGGPSGSIDTASHPGEIEIVNEALAKYLQSPIMTTPTPGAGQLVEFVGPPSSAQSVKAAGMTADVVGIANGVLVPGKMPATAPHPRAAILGWTGDTYVPAGRSYFVTFGSLPPGAGTNRVFAMPADGRFTAMSISMRIAQPASGNLVFILTKNGADLVPELSVIVPAGMPAGSRHSLAEAPVQKGDLIGIRVNNNATENSAYFNSIALVFEF